MKYPVVTSLLFFCQCCDQSLRDLHATCVIVSDPWWSIMEVSLNPFLHLWWISSRLKKILNPISHRQIFKVRCSLGRSWLAELATDLTCVFRVQIRSTSFQWKCWKGEWGSFLHNNWVYMEHCLMHSTCICGSDHGNYDWLRQSRCFSLKLILSLAASLS